MDELLGGALNLLKGLFASIRPSCWGGKAYDKARLEWAQWQVNDWVGKIRANYNDVKYISNLQLEVSQHINGMRKDIERTLKNACSIENAHKNIEMFHIPYNIVQAMYNTVYIDGYYDHGNHGRIWFKYDNPTSLKPQYQDQDVRDTVLTGGGTSTGNNPTNTNTNTNTNNPSNNGTNQTTSSNYTVIDMPCGKVRVYRDGSVTDNSGNYINVEDCKNGIMSNSNSNFASNWGATIDWGNGSVSVNGGKRDNTIIYMIGAGIIAFLLLNKKKKR